MEIGRTETAVQPSSFYPCKIALKVTLDPFQSPGPPTHKLLCMVLQGLTVVCLHSISPQNSLGQSVTGVIDCISVIEESKKNTPILMLEFSKCAWWIEVFRQ